MSYTSKKLAISSSMNTYESKLKGNRIVDCENALGSIGLCNDWLQVTPQKVQNIWTQAECGRLPGNFLWTNGHASTCCRPKGLLTVYAISPWLKLLGLESMLAACVYLHKLQVQIVHLRSILLSHLMEHGRCGQVQLTLKFCHSFKKSRGFWSIINLSPLQVQSRIILMTLLREVFLIWTESSI